MLPAKDLKAIEDVLKRETSSLPTDLSSNYEIIRRSRSICVGRVDTSLSKNGVYIHTTKINGVTYVIFFKENLTMSGKLTLYVDLVCVFQDYRTLHLFPITDWVDTPYMYSLETYTVTPEFILTLPLRTEMGLLRDNEKYQDYVRISTHLFVLADHYLPSNTEFFANPLKGLYNEFRIDGYTTKSKKVKLDELITVLDKNLTPGYRLPNQTLMLWSTSLGSSDKRNGNYLSIRNAKGYHICLAEDNCDPYFGKNSDCISGIPFTGGKSKIVPDSAGDVSLSVMTLSKHHGRAIVIGDSRGIPDRDFKVNINLKYNVFSKTWHPAQVLYQDNITGRVLEDYVPVENLLGSAIRSYIYWPRSVDLLIMVAKYHLESFIS